MATCCQWGAVVPLEITAQHAAGGQARAAGVVVVLLRLRVRTHDGCRGRAHQPCEIPLLSVHHPRLHEHSRRCHHEYDGRRHSPSDGCWILERRCLPSPGAHLERKVYCSTLLRYNQLRNNRAIAPENKRGISREIIWTKHMEEAVTLSWRYLAECHLFTPSQAIVMCLEQGLDFPLLQHVARKKYFYL